MFALSRHRAFLILTGILTSLVLIQYIRIMSGTDDNGTAPALEFPLVERGTIYDRNGKILAVSDRLHSVTAWIPTVTEPQQSAEVLSPILQKTPGEILQLLGKSKGFVYLARKISDTQSEAIRELKSQGLLKGISLEPEFGRTYPERNLVSTVLGYVGTDNIGLGGLEYSLNQVLSPPDLRAENTHGNNVYLSLDINVQMIVHKALEQVMERDKPDSVAAIVAHTSTGEILGYVNLPDFDPNKFNLSSGFERQNRIAERAYEPGSVFKIFSIATLLDKKAIASFSTFYCDGHYEKTMASGEVVSIKCNGIHGEVHPEDILRYSCNAGAAYAADLMDSRGFESALRSLGFGEKTGLPFAGEASGIFPGYLQWSGRTKPTIAFGQEIGVTALQMIQAALAVAEEGQLIQPTLLYKIISPGGDVIFQSAPKVKSRVFTKETARSVLDMLTRTVEEGTGVKARIEGIPIGGKTGTSQVRDPTTGRYSQDNFIASMMTFMPADDPQFLIYVVIDHPRGSSIQGGQIAAPVTRQIGERLIHYFNMAKTGDKVFSHDGRAALTPVSPIVLDRIVPDLRGKTKRELLPLLDRRDIKVILKGSGWVSSQTPGPGSALTPGMTLTLELE